MEGNAYVDFDLRFRKHGSGYRAEIVAAPGGSGGHTFHLPFQEHELENYLLKIGQRRSGMRKADSPENRAAREFGNKLFDTVFSGDLEMAFWKSLEAAKAGGNGLRIRLRLGDTPELADLPWEYLYQQQRREFLALSAETPIVRYFELPETVKPLAVKPPLRVLVMLSNPSDVDCLDIEKEWQKLKEAVSELETRNLLIVERLRKATLGELQARLRKCTYHVFHFVGHGSFDPVTEESVLALEDENGRKRLISGPELGIYLRDEPTLRLVILNACEGARASRTDPFSGAAQSLVLKGIPAVIAMQFEVSDEAAIALASGFYSALADDYPVDAALAEARKAVFAAGCAVEWGTPVLYLRAPDGRIFEVTKTAAQKEDDEKRQSNAAVPPPLPSLPIETDRPRSAAVTEEKPVATAPPRRAMEIQQAPISAPARPRRWVWLLVGGVGTFAFVMGLGFWWISQPRQSQQAMPRVVPDNNPPQMQNAPGEVKNKAAADIQPAPALDVDPQSARDDARSQAQQELAADAESENTYQGQVGLSAAVFVLRLTANGEVKGYYTQGGRTYRLEGTNPKGRLLLDEYTDEQHTARLDLALARSTSEIRWEGTMYNIRPNQNVYPVFLTRSGSQRAESSSSQNETKAGTDTTKSVWLFPESSLGFLSAQDVSGLDCDTLWRARNEIYARNGYIFSSERGRAYVASLDRAYRGTDTDQDRVFSRMNQFERQNVETIKHVEGLHSCR